MLNAAGIEIEKLLALPDKELRSLLRVLRRRGLVAQA
jgi:hypothetical protein